MAVKEILLLMSRVSWVLKSPSEGLYKLGTQEAFTVELQQVAILHSCRINR